MKENRFKRSKLLLKNSSQPHLILQVYLILLAVIILSGGIFYFIGNQDLSKEYFQAHSTIKSTMELLLPTLIIVNVIALLAAFFLVVDFTHSIAGPIHRLKEISKKVADGDLTPVVKFRKKDNIQDLSAAIGNIVTGLNARLRQLEASVNKLDDLENKIKEIDQPKVKEELLAVHNEIQEEIRKFKL